MVVAGPKHHFHYIIGMPALFKSGQWHFHQDNAPVHNAILVTDYLTKMGIKTVPHPPHSSDLAPCDFWLFPKLRGHCYETIEEMKEAVMKVIDTLTQEDFPEVVGTVQQVHCSQRRLLWRRRVSCVCTINESAHTKKVWKLIVCTSYISFFFFFFFFNLYKKTDKITKLRGKYKP